MLDGRAAQLRRWYPSTGGTWDAGTAWPEIVLTAANHSGSLRAALDQPPQTNEVGRSAALIGGLLRINRGSDVPVRLFEIGSSAGLNLRADHYRYRYADILHRVDDAIGNQIAAHDAAEDVDQDRAYMGIGEDQLKRRGHAIAGSPAADVEKVRGLPAVQLDQVHGRHGKACAVDHAGDIAVE